MTEVEGSSGYFVVSELSDIHSNKYLHFIEKVFLVLNPSYSTFQTNISERQNMFHPSLIILVISKL